MKRFMRFLAGLFFGLVFCVCAATAAGMALGLVTVQDLQSLFSQEIAGEIQSVAEEAVRSAADSGGQIYSRLADYVPPTGDGQLLEGELPEDLLPGDARVEQDFPERLYPYRAMLTAVEQGAYDQIYANAAELYETIPLYQPLSTDSLLRAINAVYYDHPELFWLESAYQYNYTPQGEVVAVTLRFNSLAGDIETHRSRYDSVVRQVVAGAKVLETPVEQEKYVHDWLLDNVSYQLGAPYNQSAYSALVGGQSVCAGYARAFQHILLELDIPCYYCVGDAGEPHAWNIVELEGEYYHVDVAWDDPMGNDEGRRYYNYFNLTDGEIREDHTRTDLSVNLPPCNGTAYAYRTYFGENEGDSGFYLRESDLPTLEELGFSTGDVITSFQNYASYCENRLVQLGTGSHTLVLPVADKELVDEIFRQTEAREAMERYVRQAAERLGLNGYSFNISLQAEPMAGDYWLLTQQMQLDSQGGSSPNAPPMDTDPPPSRLPEEPEFPPDDLPQWEEIDR